MKTIKVGDIEVGSLWTMRMREIVLYLADASKKRGTSDVLTGDLFILADFLMLVAEQMDPEGKGTGRDPYDQGPPTEDPVAPAAVAATRPHALRAVPLEQATPAPDGAVCARCGAGPWMCGGARRAIVQFRGETVCAPCLVKVEGKPAEDEGESCTCSKGHEESTCPYQEEINEITTNCSCCPYCREQCSADI